MPNPPEIDLSRIQRQNKLFLSGPFGSGKTTLAIQRIQWLLSQKRTRGDDILVVVPQRTLAQSYHDALRSPDTPAGPPVRITTLAGLARQSLELYWPLLSKDAGFAEPGNEPTFLNLETSQYHMAQFVNDAISRAEFDGIHIERSRIISQILDNLNKAALQGFTIDETYQRLELAVPAGENRTARLNVLRSAARISQAFRSLCLRQTLIDFSLQIDIFNCHVITNEWCMTHLFRSHRHIIFDNLEEDTITAQLLAARWLTAGVEHGRSEAESALLISDSDAGYRVFLGAAPQGISALIALCDEHIALDSSFIMSPELTQLTTQIDVAILGRKGALHGNNTDGTIEDPVAERDEPFFGEEEEPNGGNPFDDSVEDEVAANPLIVADEGSVVAMQTVLDQSLILPDQEFRFYPQMIDWAVEEARRQIQDEGVAPEQVAILAPYVSDALRFSLETGLARFGIELTTHRPSRALQDEPAARSLLTLATLAHPEWGIRPAPTDVTQMLTLVIEPLDPVRANLLSRIVYPPRSQRIELSRFGQLESTMKERITFAIGEQYDQLREWIYAYRVGTESTPLDQFFARIFGELLSQPGYGFHDDYDSARVANQLVVSARNFRWALETNAALTGQRLNSALDLAREYLQLIDSGALGALYVPGWKEAENAILLAPAYTFLMRNRAVDVQIWLDVGSGGWWERLYQPLTHPHVLSKFWPADKVWSDFDEFGTRQDTMRRVLVGLIRRTRKQIFLGMSDYSESGFEQRGPLLLLINRMLAQSRGAELRKS